MTARERPRRGRPKPSEHRPATVSRWPRWAPATVLIVLTFVAYLPAIQGGFIWDDNDYVTGNAVLRTTDGLRRIWMEPDAVPQYYPLTFTTFWLEYRAWGLSA